MAFDLANALAFLAGRAAPRYRLASAHSTSASLPTIAVVTSTKTVAQWETRPFLDLVITLARKADKEDPQRKSSPPSSKERRAPGM